MGTVNQVFLFIFYFESIIETNCKAAVTSPYLIATLILLLTKHTIL